MATNIYLTSLVVFSVTELQSMVAMITLLSAFKGSEDLEFLPGFDLKNP